MSFTSAPPSSWLLKKANVAACFGQQRWSESVERFVPESYPDTSPVSSSILQCVSLRSIERSFRRVRRQCLIRRPRSTQPLLRRSASFEELHRFHPQLRQVRQQTCLLFPFSSFQTVELRFHGTNSRIPPCSFHMRPFRHAPRGFSCLKALLPTAMGPPPPPSRGTCLPSGTFRPPSAHVASASGALRCETTRATPPKARDEPMDQWPTGIDAPLYGKA